MFKRTRKKKEKVKSVQFKRKDKLRTPKKKEKELKKVLDAPIQDYLPVLASNITDITPDELMFAYSWAKYPNNPLKALNESGVYENIVGAGTERVGSTKGKIIKELISTSSVQKAFREGLLNRIQSLKATNDKSRRYLSCIAYLDKVQAFRDDGTLLPIHKMPFHVRVCVQEYEEKEVRPVKGSPYTIRKIKFSDNKDALKILLQETNKAGESMSKLLGSNNTFIQNITSTNIIGSGNNYNNLIQDKLDLTKLKPKEIDILFKALNIKADGGALAAQNLIEEVIDVKDITPDKEEERI